MINLGETENIEFKRELNESVKKAIIAFANTNGGKIYIGVEDDGTVTGLANAKQDLESVSNSIRDAIKPDLTLFTNVHIKEINGKDIIEIEVGKGTKKPYHLISKGMKPSGVFVRHGITSAPASEDAIRRMIIESDGIQFENVRCMNQELTFEYANKFFYEMKVPFEDAQKRTLGLTDEDGYYTNLGLLLSDQCEHTTKCAIYNGVNKLSFRDRKEFEGSVLKQIDDTYSYLSLYNKTKGEFEGIKRIDTSDYPSFALRESLINAITHRDYNFSGSILIHIFDDRIEFVSLGGLVSGITRKDILFGVSESRNKRLANCFYRLQLIESYGTGIQRINESYADFDVLPQFEISDNAFLVILPNVNYERTAASNEDSVMELITRNTTVTRKELEEELNLSKSSVNILLNKLLQEKKIKQHGKARNTKYTLYS